MVLGSGIDVIEVARIERSLARFGARFERRVFSPSERAVCRRSRRPAFAYALRFAAKEALMKAVGTGWSQGVRWLDIETCGGAPEAVPARLVLHGRAREIARARGGDRTHLAMAAGGGIAVATVLLETDAA